MPIRYDSYQLANSQRVKPFVGSVLPELTSVAGTLQERFDKVLENEDLLTRAVNLSQAAPFENDRLLLNQMKQEFRDRLNQRAQRGDYENMYRETMLDARNFADRYQPIADNARRYQEYQNTLQQAVAKGDIKSPDKARRLLALSTQTYQGLNYDPVTGAVTNRFQGLPFVKDIDPTEKVDKWMKDIAPTVLGSEVRYTDGVWKRFKEGKYVTLTADEIGRVLDAGRRLDPEFDAWLQQEKQLSTTDIERITDADIQNMQDGPLKQQITAEMARTGKPATAILRDMMSSDRENNILRNMAQYANKYIRDDRQVGSGILGADEYNLARFNKKMEDEIIPISMPILQPETRASIAGAEDLMTKLRDASTAASNARLQVAEWINRNQVRPDGKGGWIDGQGNDVTLKYLEQQQVADQAREAWQNLQKLDAEARRRTGYGSGTVSAKLMQDAERYAEKQLLAAQQPGGPGGVPAQMSDEQQRALKQRAKADYLRRRSPGYEQYDRVLQEMTKQGSQVVNVTPLTSDKANKQATAVFKNLVLNLDAKGLKAGPVGLQWALGPKAGQELEDDDYKKVAAEAEFAGVAMDTDGQMKAYFNVGKVTQNNKGELKGEQSVVKMPALPGMEELLIKSRQIQPAQLILGQKIQQALNTPAGSGYIDVGNGDQIQVQRIDQNQLATGDEVGPGLNLRFPAGNGTYTEIRVGSVGEAIKRITNAMQRRAARQK